MKNISNWLAIILTTGVAALGVAVVDAGPLDPPAGPAEPTGRTVLEIEPRIPIGTVRTTGSMDAVFRIINPGNYYLTADVQGIDGKDGIEILDGATSRDCIASRNTASGFGVDKDNLLIECIAEANEGFGIEADNSCQITDNVVGGNGGDGITVARASVVIGCNVFGDGAAAVDSAGIRATANQVRIQDNQVVDNDIGIVANVDGGCFIVRNTLDNITQDFALQGTNIVGPLNDLTNPWANFTY